MAISIKIVSQIYDITSYYEILLYLYRRFIIKTRQSKFGPIKNFGNKITHAHIYNRVISAATVLAFSPLVFTVSPLPVTTIFFDDGADDAIVLHTPMVFGKFE